MKKLLCFLIPIFIFCGCKKDTGFNIGYTPITEYKYKSYSGTPAIDSGAFYQNVVMKKNEQGACRYIVTQYKDLPQTEVQKLANANDADAIMELFSRSLGNDFLNNSRHTMTDAEIALLERAKAQRNSNGIIYDAVGMEGSLATQMRRLRGENNQNFKILEKYETINPLAILMWHEIRVEGRVIGVEIKNEEHPLKFYNLLKNSQGYPFAMLIASLYPETKNIDEFNWSYKGSHNIDKDLFCEAYYSGCNVYELKQFYDIKCAQ